MRTLGRLAAVGCLVGCCLQTSPWPAFGFAAAALVFAALAEGTRSDWCHCGHIKAVHQHYSQGTYCSSCGCNRFNAPFARRTS